MVYKRFIKTNFGFKRVRSKEEVEQILRCYDSLEASVHEIPNAKLSVHTA